MHEAEKPAVNKIPKIIHYCWLSDNEMPQRIKDCLESWRTVMPDYEIRRWSLDSFDVNSVKWVKQAVEQKKWAFAADYIRLYALYTVGGIYLDSDVRAIKSFDPFLWHRGFTGIEWRERMFLYRPDPQTTGINMEFAILGAEKGHPMIKACMEHYHGRDFVVNGKQDQTVLPVVMTPIVEKFGFNKYDYWSHQVLEGDFHVYPYDYFPAQTSSLSDIFVTHNTVAIHLHTASWKDFDYPVRKVRSPFTELRLHLKDFLKNVKEDVFVRKHLVIDGKKFKRIKNGR